MGEEAVVQQTLESAVEQDERSVQEFEERSESDLRSEIDDETLPPPSPPMQLTPVAAGGCDNGSHQETAERSESDLRSVIGDETPPPPSPPMQRTPVAAGGCDGGSHQETEDLCDEDPKPVVSGELGADDSNNHIQTFKDDCIIPSPVLKGINAATFFGLNPTSALQFLGAKYNGVLNKLQEQTSELESLRVDCENLGNRCLQECQPKYEALKQKYTKECAERKRLYNELIELKGNIRVFCRCRPLSAEESSKGYTSVFDFDPTQDTELQIISSDSSKKQFKFDHVFGPKDNQEVVFAETLPVVHSVLDGYNSCIFAYGQTGTGKTFTMEGTPDNRGVNYRALEELFRHSEERSSSIRYEFSVSMLEVYNEKIRDLLAENLDQATKRLDIKQAADGTQDVPGLVEAQVANIGEVWEMLTTGAKNRSVGSTNANELSSRSHCLIRVTIKGENLVNGQRSRSHMWLVDLAGSERVGKIEVEGERLKESQFINKSLSALGDVISALATKNPHIPYRNSKLTHLLQSSLGGDCKTLMFAQISPSSADLGETLCSLNFASRVRGIEHGPVRRQADPVESFKLKQMAEKLRQEEKDKARLTESLQMMNLKYLNRENVFKTLHEKIRDAEQACRNYQQKVRDLENQIADEKRGRNQETRGSGKYSRLPLVPINPRGKTTNRLPPSGPRRSAVDNKENTWAMDKSSSSTSGKVQRVPVQHKRRATIAILPAITEKLAALPETHQLQHSSINTRFSQMRDPRRRSVATFMPVAAGTAVATSRAAVLDTPDSKGSFRSSQIRDPRRRSVATFMPVASPDSKGSFSNFSSSSKYSSPPMKALWKSRIPPMGSPRQKLRLVSSPAASSSSQSKLCFSVQKRVIVGSPLQQRPAGLSILHQALRDRDAVGKLGGTAQRVLCRNRRRSVI